MNEIQMSAAPTRHPRIVYSSLTGTWFLLTRYRKVRRRGKSFLRAQEKFDITDQMVTIIREVQRRTLKIERGRHA